MRVAVRLFARYREVTGRERLDLDLPEGSTVETAWGAVSNRHPGLAQYRAFTLFAVGHEYVQPDHVLHAGDELCLFPPVSGGRARASEVHASRRALLPDRDLVRACGVEPGRGGVAGSSPASPWRRRVTGPGPLAGPPAGRVGPTGRAGQRAGEPWRRR